MEYELLCNDRNSTNEFLNSNICKKVVKYNYKESNLWGNIYNINFTPVNIIKSNCLPINKNFIINYSYTHNYKIIVNNNSRYLVPILSCPYIIYDNELYNLIQFHIHHNSENKINNEIFKMEIHFVHKNKNGKILVLGFLLDIGEESLFDEEIFKYKTSSNIHLNLSKLNIFENLPCYFFEGTLTTPPFTNNVQWILFSPTDIIGLTITKKIYDIFSKECNNNSFRNNNSNTIVYYRN